MILRRLFSAQPSQSLSKKLDFALHPKRRIVFSFYYYGWKHDGMQIQKTPNDNSVAARILKALLHARLIEDPVTCFLRYAGRTDTGVSGLEQMASCIVRSGNPKEPGVFWPDSTPVEVRENYESFGELPYVTMLNKRLPSSIRVLKWAPVHIDFYVRHAASRTYTYLIPRADLDLEAMRVAAAHLIGEHDFRNFCKTNQIDLSRVELLNFTRIIHDISIKLLGADQPYSLLELKITANAFHYHMIRLIVSVLHSIGRGDEQAEVVEQLLHVDTVSSRPAYVLSPPEPLCFVGCTFPTEEFDWRYDDVQRKRSLAVLQKDWAELKIRTRILEQMMDEVRSASANNSSPEEYEGLKHYIQSENPSQYIPIMKRQRCYSVDVAKEIAAAKRLRKNKS